MEIEKDSNREAFELVVANQLQNSLYHSVFFNEATGWYYCADDAPAAVQVFCFDLNSDWRIWKAAKAQAIPDGFVLVSVDTLEECLDWAHIAKWDSPSNEVDKKIAHHEALIESAISAQEQAND